MTDPKVTARIANIKMFVETARSGIDYGEGVDDAYGFRMARVALADVLYELGKLESLVDGLSAPGVQDEGEAACTCDPDPRRGTSACPVCVQAAGEPSEIPFC